MNVKPYDLRRRLYIIMRGEEGLDYGGIARWDEAKVVFCLGSKVFLCRAGRLIWHLLSVLVVFGGQVPFLELYLPSFFLFCRVRRGRRCAFLGSCCKRLLLFPPPRSSHAAIPVLSASLHHDIRPSHVSLPLPLFALFRASPPLHVITLQLAAVSCVFCFCFFLFSSLILHCVSVSGVSSVVLPYGRWHHAVLPQGRTTDGMLEGVCVHPSVHTHLSQTPPSRGAGPAWLWWWSLWCYCWGAQSPLTCICLSVLFFFCCLFLPRVHIPHCMCRQVIICASQVGAAMCLFL